MVTLSTDFQYDFPTICKMAEIIARYEQIKNRYENLIDSNEFQQGYEQMAKIALELKKILKERGYQVTLKGNDYVLYEISKNQSVGLDNRRRNERPRFRKQINKLIKENDWTIDDVINHYHTNTDHYIKGFLTQANKMKYEEMFDEEMILLDDLSKKIDDWLKAYS